MQTDWKLQTEGEACYLVASDFKAATRKIATFANRHKRYLQFFFVLLNGSRLSEVDGIGGHCYRIFRATAFGGIFISGRKRAGSSVPLSAGRQLPQCAELLNKQYQTAFAADTRQRLQNSSQLFSPGLNRNHIVRCQGRGSPIIVQPCACYRLD